MTANYDTEILATVAAGSIDALGATPITYGCSITHIGTGAYNLILPTGDGLISQQCFTSVQTRAGITFAVVSDQSDTYTKTITVFNNAGAVTDTPIDIVVRRSTINPF
jgi:hypothetical protein